MLVCPGIRSHDMLQPGLMHPRGIFIHGSRRFSAYGSQQICHHSMIKNRFIPYITRVIKYIIVIQIGRVFLIFLPIGSLKESIVIQWHYHHLNLLPILQRPVKVLTQFPEICARKWFLHGMRAKQFIQLACLKVLSHGGSGNHSIISKMP